MGRWGGGCSDRMSYVRSYRERWLRSTHPPSRETDSCDWLAFPSRFAFSACWMFSIWAILPDKPLRAQEAPLSREEKREQIAAERFLQLLLRRPTHRDRTRSGIWLSRRSRKLGRTAKRLGNKADQAAKAGDEKTAGNHWMVIGLLQLAKRRRSRGGRGPRESRGVL